MHKSILFFRNGLIYGIYCVSSWLAPALVTSLGLWLGSSISRGMVRILEENEIFVPDDDDDE